MHSKTPVSILGVGSLTSSIIPSYETRIYVIAINVI